MDVHRKKKDNIRGNDDDSAAEVKETTNELGDDITLTS